MIIEPPISESPIQSVDHFKGESEIPDFSNLQTFLSYLLTARSMIHRELNNLLNNYIELNLRALYTQACLINSREPLKMFQLSLCRLPILAKTQIDEDYAKFIKFVAPELLIRVKHNTKHLSELYGIIQYVKEHKSFPAKNLKTQLMPIKDFLHRCYIYTGRRLWNHPELLSHKYPRASLDSNRILLRKYINEGIEDVVNDFIKLDDFYNSFGEIVKNTNIELNTKQDDVKPNIINVAGDSMSNNNSYSNNSKSNNSESNNSESSVSESNNSDSSASNSKSKIDENMSNPLNLLPSLNSEISGGDPSNKKESSPKVASLCSSLPVGIKCPISNAKINVLPETKYNFDYVTDKKIRIELLKPISSKPRSILKISSPDKKTRKITFRLPAKLIKITNLMQQANITSNVNTISKMNTTPKPKVSEAHTTQKDNSPVKPNEKKGKISTKETTTDKTPSTISTIASPELKLLNDKNIITEISSNNSDSFQLSTPKAEVNNATKENNLSTGHIESAPSSKSNIFSFENDLPGISSSDPSTVIGPKDIANKQNVGNDSDILEITIDDKYFRNDGQKKRRNKSKPRHLSSDDEATPPFIRAMDKVITKSGKRKYQIDKIDRSPSPISSDLTYSADSDFSKFDETETVETNIARLNKFMNLDLSPKDLLKFGGAQETKSLTGEKINEFATQYDKVRAMGHKKQQYRTKHRHH